MQASYQICPTPKFAAEYSATNPGKPLSVMRDGRFYRRVGRRNLWLCYRVRGVAADCSRKPADGGTR